MQYVASMNAFFPSLAFLGVGDQEMLLIMVVILIFFGGKKMPDFARGLGKALKEFKRATGDVEREFKRVLEEAENPMTTMRDTFKPEGTIPSIDPSGLIVEPAIAPPPGSPPALGTETAEPAHAEPSTEPSIAIQHPDVPHSEPPSEPQPHVQPYVEHHSEGEHEYHSDI
jgi:TatA/E family protein of Tat protein translocase